MKLAFVFCLGETLISSSDPHNHVVRKDAGKLLTWCEKYGEIFLHTDIPMITKNHEVMTDVRSLLEKMEFGGKVEIWTGEQEARNRSIRKSKEASGFGQTKSVMFDPNIDRIAGYSHFQENGYTIFHIGAGLEDIEKRQLEALGGHFIEVDPMPNPKLFGIRFDKGEEKYTIFREEGERDIGTYPFSDFEQNLNFNELKKHGEKFHQEILNRHHVDIDDGIMNLVPMEVVKILGEQKLGNEAPIKKSENPTMTAIDYWSENTGRKGPSSGGKDA